MASEEVRLKKEKKEKKDDVMTEDLVGDVSMAEPVDDDAEVDPSTLNVIACAYTNSLLTLQALLLRHLLLRRCSRQLRRRPSPVAM